MKAPKRKLFGLWTENQFQIDNLGEMYKNALNRRDKARAKRVFPLCSEAQQRARLSRQKWRKKAREEAIKQLICLNSRKRRVEKLRTAETSTRFECGISIRSVFGSVFLLSVLSDVGVRPATCRFRARGEKTQSFVQKLQHSLHRHRQPGS